MYHNKKFSGVMLCIAVCANCTLYSLTVSLCLVGSYGMSLNVSSLLCSFVTKISAMGPYEEGEAIESISFMKESDKYSLHQILWDNEDHLSNAIIAMRLVVFQILVLEWKYRMA